MLHKNWLASPASPGQEWLVPDLSMVEPDVPTYFKSLLAVPLLVEGRRVGGLLWLYRATRTFTTEEVQLGFTFADQAALAIANDQLRGQAQETAVMRERHRLARDLHDAVTQTLFSASLIAEVLPATWVGNQAKGEKLLVELNQLNRGAMAEMRSLLLELRPSALTEADLSHLLKQLGQMVTGRTGIPVTVQVEEPCLLLPAVQEALYRIAQEACNNIVKHAQADEVWITMTYEQIGDVADDERTLCLRIKDDGCGFTPTANSATHLGMGIMQERAEAIGARFTLRSQPDLGTEIMVWWRD
ncbi:MAG: GAF domain-containing sensor histidine kinase [Anaerolineae bacterium]|nr:GAF domain-containing sensor histidine kinase [Anaerolineae bacterium]